MDDIQVVVLADIPAALALEHVRHVDAYLRELRLMSFADHPVEIPDLAAILRRVGDIQRAGAADRRADLEHIQAALAAGETTVTIARPVPRALIPFAVSAIRDHTTFVELADEAARAGQLLSPPMSGELVALRRWVVSACLAQLEEGGGPAHWPGFPGVGVPTPVRS